MGNRETYRRNPPGCHRRRIGESWGQRKAKHRTLPEPVPSLKARPWVAEKPERCRIPQPTPGYREGW